MDLLAKTIMSFISEVLSSCIAFEYQPGVQKNEVTNDIRQPTQDVDMCTSLPVSTFEFCNENDGWELLDNTTQHK